MFIEGFAFRGCRGTSLSVLGTRAVSFPLRLR
jgi:hypothetical protein